MLDGDKIPKFDAWQDYKAQVSWPIMEFFRAQNGSNILDLLEALYDINYCSIDVNAKFIAVLARALPETDPEIIRTWIEDNIVPFVDSGTPNEDTVPLVRLAY